MDKILLGTFVALLNIITGEIGKGADKKIGDSRSN